MAQPDASETSRRYRDFARRDAGSTYPVYRDWCTAIADDSEMLELIGSVPEERRQPNLVLSASRLHGAPIGEYGAFRSWFLANWPRIRETVLTRRTQTNEIGRTAVLLPALASVPGPLSLIEVGASAGLCLFPDEVSYRYSTAPGAEPVRIDPAAGISPVLVECAISGEPPLPRELPTIVHRSGVDLEPLDVRNPGDARWLESLVWPGRPERMTRLRASVELVRERPPHIVQGDLNEHIERLVAAAPSDSTVVVFHSAVLVYLDERDRRRFQETVTALDCHWISNEALGVVETSGPVPDRPETGPDPFLLALDGRPLAWAGPHGQSLDWFGAETSA